MRASSVTCLLVRLRTSGVLRARARARARAHTHTHTQGYALTALQKLELRAVPAACFKLRKG